MVRVRREEAVAVGLVVLRPDERGSAGQQRQREQHGDHAEDDHHDPGDASTAHAADPSPAGCSAGFRRGPAARAAPSRSRAQGGARNPGMSPRCTASSTARSSPARSATSIVCSSQCRGAEAAAAERQDQLLARGVQPARGAVEAVEHDALDGRVDAAGAAGARIARVGDLRRRLAQSTAPELDRDEREPADEQPARTRSAGARRLTTPPGRGRATATSSASAANSGADEERGAARRG